MAVIVISVVAGTGSEAVSGDTLKKTLKGAAIGGLVGAVVDGSDAAVKGAAIGGAVGLAAGVLGDDDDDDNRKKKRKKKKKNKNKHRDRVQHYGRDVR